jgi:hypothetical protein
MWQHCEQHLINVCDHLRSYQYDKSPEQVEKILLIEMFCLLRSFYHRKSEFITLVARYTIQE